VSRSAPAAYSTALLIELRARGYQGGITILKEFVAGFLPEKRGDPVVRFETEPGEQMQAGLTEEQAEYAAVVKNMQRLRALRLSRKKKRPRSSARRSPKLK
jgi:transposase